MSVVVPIVYDIEQNQTSIVQKGEMSPVGSIANQIISNLMQSGALNTGRCTIMPCVRELLMNLTLPNEGPSNPMIQGHPMHARPPMQVNIIRTDVYHDYLSTIGFM